MYWIPCPKRFTASQNAALRFSRVIFLLVVWVTALFEGERVRDISYIQKTSYSYLKTQYKQNDTNGDYRPVRRTGV
jgi:hypothetical protein